MQFPKTFKRYIGAGLAPLLGSDVDPTTLSAPAQKAYMGNANVLTSRMTNINGFPAQRILVGVNYEGAGAPAPIPLSVFLWDDTTERWYKIFHAVAPTIPVNHVLFVDTCSLLDFMTTSAMEVALVASAPAGAPDGTYTFVAGCDVSSPGI